MNLCQLPTCRQRNRHLPGCVDDCLGCLPRVAEEGIVCSACVDRAARHLAEIERLCPDARLVAAGQVRRGHGGTGGKPGSRPPLNVDAVDALDAVQGALTTMAREIAEERGLHFVSTAFDGHRVADLLVEAATWLTGQLGWLRHATGAQGQPVAVDVFREIGDCAARMRSLVDGPREQKYLGPCGAERDVTAYCDCDCHIGPYATCNSWSGCGVTGAPHRATCEGDVYGVAGAQSGRCRTCGATYRQQDRQDWIDTVRRDWLYHASEITEAYPEVNENTIRTWHHRGQLSAHGEHDGRPLFKVGEVLDLAAESAARREEQRVARERRAARRIAEMGA